MSVEVFLKALPWNGVNVQYRSRVPHRKISSMSSDDEPQRQNTHVAGIRCVLWIRIDKVASHAASLTRDSGGRFHKSRKYWADRQHGNSRCAGKYSARVADGRRICPLYCTVLYQGFRSGSTFFLLNHSGQ